MPASKGKEAVHEVSKNYRTAHGEGRCFIPRSALVLLRCPAPGVLRSRRRGAGEGHFAQDLCREALKGEGSRGTFACHGFPDFMPSINLQKPGFDANRTALPA